MQLLLFNSKFNEESHFVHAFGSFSKEQLLVSA